MKNRIVSIHVPKTGGTSFIEILKNHFGDKLLLDNGLNEGDSIIPFNNGVFDCVHGHFPATKYYPRFDSIYAFWVRNPLDRLISHYNFWKCNDFSGHREWDLFNRENMSLSEFAFSDISINHQSLYINDESLIHRADFVGVTEFFDLSIILFSAVTGIEVGYTPHLRKADNSLQLNEVLSDRAWMAKFMRVHSRDYLLYLKSLDRFNYLCSKYDVL